MGLAVAEDIEVPRIEGGGETWPPEQRKADPLALDARFWMSGTQASNPGRGKAVSGALICKSCFNYLEMISSVALKPKRLQFPPLVKSH